MTKNSKINALWKGEWLLLQPRWDLDEGQSEFLGTTIDLKIKSPSCSFFLSFFSRPKLAKLVLCEGESGRLCDHVEI